MVVGGVPVPVSTHAERVANFSLGMIIAAKEVKNPVSGNPIQVSHCHRFSSLLLQRKGPWGLMS